MSRNLRLHACLMFHSARSDNLGVTALTVAQVSLLRSQAIRLGVDLHITILDWKDPRPPCIDGDDITHIAMSARDMLDPRRALATMRAANVILDVGAGDSFTDLYGSRRFRRMTWMKNLARISGTPVVLAPQTYGPFRSRTARFWAARTIRNARIVATRDDASLNTLRNLGIEGPICAASDLALRLPATAPIQMEGTNIGLNVSGLLWNGGYSGANQFGLAVDYKAMMREIVLRLRSQPEAPRIWLVPHVISEDQPVEDDVRAGQALSELVGGLAEAPRFDRPQAAKGFISGLDYFAGARMHSCIAAFTSDVPVIPMAYSGKFAQLFGALGYQRTVDCRSLQQGECVEQVVQGFEQRALLRVEAREAFRNGLNRLTRYEQALSELLQAVASGAEMLNPADRVQP